MKKQPSSFPLSSSFSIIFQLLLLLTTTITPTPTSTLALVLDRSQTPVINTTTATNMDINNTTTAHNPHPPANLQKVPITPGSSCLRGPSRTPLFHIATNIWTLHVPHQLLPSSVGTGAWGGGLLDHLRSACGDITGWFVELDGNGRDGSNGSNDQSVSGANGNGHGGHQGIKVLFYSPVCTLADVEGAVWGASLPDRRVVVRCESVPRAGGGGGGGSGGDDGAEVELLKPLDGGGKAEAEVEEMES